MKTVRIISLCLLCLALARYTPHSAKRSVEVSSSVRDSVANNELVLHDDSVFIRGDYKVVAAYGTSFELLLKGEKPVNSTIRDTIYSDHQVVLLGDNEKRGIHLFKKFKFPTRFEDFKTTIYKGSLAPPDFNTDPKAKHYITAIKTGCKELGINYAGHYTLITIGCGSSCAVMAVVDRITGRVIYSSIDLTISNGCEFNAESSLFILNAGALDDRKEYFDLMYQYGDEPASFQLKGNKLIRLQSL